MKLVTSPGLGWKLLVILLVGFIIRIYITFWAGLPHLFSDSVGYFRQADTLLEGGYTNYFPNGYPFIIAGFKIFGGIYLKQLLLCLNIILSTWSIFLIYQISKAVFKLENVALLTAFALAVMPSQINYVRWFSSEVPTVFFLLTAYLFYYKRKYFVAGLFFGLATAVRTELLLVLFVLAGLELIWMRKINFYLLLGTAIPVLMLGFYCYAKTGVFSISGHARTNILLSVESSGHYVNWQYEDNHPEATTTAAALHLYFGYFKDHPAQFIKNKLTNLWELWGFFPSSAGGTRSVISRLIIGGVNFILIVFGLNTWWKNRKSFSVFILPISFFILTPIHMMLVGIPRYTFPAEPFMLLLACWSLTLLFSYKKEESLKFSGQPSLKDPAGHDIR